MPDDGSGRATLADEGESGVLARIFPRLATAHSAEVGPGDDAAVLAAPDARVVVTTDVMVEGRDFRPEWSTAYDVGWKSAAQNLADIAAMGAVPTGLVVGLVAPGTTLLTWVEGLADGLGAACAGSGAAVVGGDLSSGDRVVVSVTALGDLEGRAPILRSGAKVGDTVALAGRVGWSAAGLALLASGRPDVGPLLVAAHLRPEPPYAAGPAAARAGATAMLDVSDGLLLDAGRIAAASEVTMDLDLGVLTELATQLSDAAEALGDNGIGLRWVLAGGEDHPLLATFPGPVPDGFTRIGWVREVGSAPVLVDGGLPDELAGGATGWDHFAG